MTDTDKDKLIHSLLGDVGRIRDRTFKLRRRPSSTRHQTADEIDQLAGEMQRKLMQLNEVTR